MTVTAAKALSGPFAPRNEGLSHRGGELPSGYLAQRFAHSWPTSTRHLHVLEAAGVVTVRRDGRNVAERLGVLAPYVVHGEPAGEVIVRRSGLSPSEGQPAVVCQVPLDFEIMYGPSARWTRPDRLIKSIASAGEDTIGSPWMLSDVLRSTPRPVFWRKLSRIR